MKHIVILFLVSGLLAQKNDHDERGHRKDENKEHKRSERMESMMIWKLTDALELSSEQAEKFFPRFREHRQTIEALHGQERERGADMRRSMGENEDISRSEIEKTIKAISELRKNVIDLEVEFILGIDDVLSPKQMALLGIFKQRMMEDMRGEMMDKDHKRGKKKKKGRRRGGYGKKSRGF